ncbi:MAG TPA: hypothetical protein PKM63_12130 [Panacibacter sp.]|nr:hypothetical protein [Panacibacter sp.]HNP45027.1 hypothetical protein [Panacibacter sp.]
MPTSNWLCILVDNDRHRRYLDEVIGKIINNDVCYVCTIGHSCEMTHDLVDEEIAFRNVDFEMQYLPKHHIMTIWHTDFDEGIWFAVYDAHHEEIQIDKVVVLDMTSGDEFDRINKLLTDLKSTG